MKKRILAILLTAVMALSMVACGSKETASTDDAAATTDDAAVEDEAPADDAEATTAGEAYHFEIIVKSFQSTYWQAAVQGIEQACSELGVTANSNGRYRKSSKRYRFSSL